jgi:hypothetical protein
MLVAAIGQPNIRCQDRQSHQPLFLARMKSPRGPGPWRDRYRLHRLRGSCLESNGPMGGATPSSVLKRKPLSLSLTHCLHPGTYWEGGGMTPQVGLTPLPGSPRPLPLFMHTQNNRLTWTHNNPHVHIQCTYHVHTLYVNNSTHVHSTHLLWLLQKQV